MTLSSFINKKLYEKIVYKVRRHPITLFPAIISLFILLAIPPAVFLLMMATTPSFLNNSKLVTFLTLLASTYYLSVGLFYYTYFVNYYIDLLVVTNDRLLVIKQQGIFARTISELDLYKIQDITSSIKGFFPTMFNYGNLLVQTAGEIQKFDIKKVPEPERLRQRILELAEEDRKFHQANALHPVA